MPDLPATARTRRRWKTAAILGAAGFGLSLGAALSALSLNLPTGAGQRTVIVPDGATGPEIAALLHREGLVRSPRFLRLLAIASGAGKRLRSGAHPFSGRMSTWQVLQELQVARDVTRDVTVPEGLRRHAIIAILADSLGLSADTLSFLSADPAFCRSVGVPAPDLEGYLFPETYRFSLAMDEARVLSLMVQHFFRAFDDSLRAGAGRLGLSIHEAVTLASIIEGEARVDSERALISAVYHNRLRAGMRLQADPTVQFAIPDGPRRLFYKDYAVDSPYNTYLRKGLPPGPIGNPGAASLRAAICPAEVDFVYFVARGDGTHVFSRTPQEHERAKRQTLPARRRSWHPGDRAG